VARLAVTEDCKESAYFFNPQSASLTAPLLKEPLWLALKRFNIQPEKLKCFSGVYMHGFGGYYEL
ncbi:MAG: hypothetical protein U0L20_07615, partial [Ruminococcus sp.]|nr:hypothetical protein [Ruminococcus sp.]